MKQRKFETPQESASRTGLQCSTLGTLPRWQFTGFVQDVAVNRKYAEDYIKFCIKEDPSDKFYEVFSVTLPHEVGVELQIGDHVVMCGSIRTWPMKDATGHVCGRKIELVCASVHEWSDLDG